MKANIFVRLYFILALCLAVPASLTLTGCSGNEEPDELVDPNKKPDPDEGGDEGGDDEPILPDGVVVAYPAVPGLLTSTDFTVKANGTAIWVEKYEVPLPTAPYKSGEEDFRNKVSGYMGTQRTAFARFETDGGTRIEIETQENISECIVHPKSRNIAVSGIGTKKVTFDIAKADKLYVEIPGLPELYIFADEPEAEGTKPDPNDPTYHYFAAGQIYTLTEPLKIVQGDTKRNVYIEAGAAVHGYIEFNSISSGGGVLHGRGILDATSMAGAYNVIKMHYSQGINIKDLHMRTATRGWMCYVFSSVHTTFDNVKITGYGANNDGIPSQGSKSLNIKNSFIRSTDDCITLKAEAGTADITVNVENCTMYGVASSDGFVAGYECKGQLNKVTVKNCDILGGRGSSMLGHGHAGFSVACDGPGPIKDITFENIRVENKVYENNLNLIVTDGTAYLQGSYRGQPGSISGITLKNIQWENAIKPIRIEGHSADHTVSDILFDGCTVGGLPLTATSTYYTTYMVPNINEFTSNIRFR